MKETLMRENSNYNDRFPTSFKDIQSKQSSIDIGCYAQTMR